MKIKKGDTVKIILGKDRGKSGKVIKSLPRINKVIIDGLNLYKKHVRPKRQGESGEMVRVPRPMNASNIMLICPTCQRATRISWQVKDVQKRRICKKCGANF